MFAGLSAPPAPVVKNPFGGAAAPNPFGGGSQAQEVKLSPAKNAPVQCAFAEILNDLFTVTLS